MNWLFKKGQYQTADMITVMYKCIKASDKLE